MISIDVAAIYVVAAVAVKELMQSVV